MKKLLVVVMSIIMVLSLCACGGKGASGNGGLLSSEPTEQENEVISTYVNILNALESYLEDGEISIYDVENEVDVEGSKALEYCYKTIQELESVDKWIGTEYISDTRTRNEILDAFTIVKDVKLQEELIKLDFLGNVKGDAQVSTYTYDEQGKIVEEDIESVFFENYFSCFDNNVSFIALLRYNNIFNSTYSYGTNGNLESVQNDDIRLTPVYGESGEISSVEMLSADDGEKIVCSMSYDSQKRLSKMETNKARKEENKVETYQYTYDDTSKLVREEYLSTTFRNNQKSYEWGICTDYTYDNTGNVISGVKTWNSGESWRFTTIYDEEGRLITVNYEYVDEAGTVQGMYKTEMTYGDLYSYNPNK